MKQRYHRACRGASDLAVEHDEDGDVVIKLDGKIVCWVRADDDGSQRIKHGPIDGREQEAPEQ